MVSNSKIKVDFVANTSDFSKGVSSVNEMVNEMDSILGRIKQKSSQPIFDTRSLRSVDDLLRSLKEAEKMVNKVSTRNSGATKSKRNRPAQQEDNVFKSAIKDDANKQIQQLKAQLTKQRSQLASESKVVPKYTLNRGKVKTNQNFDDFQYERNKNRAGIQTRASLGDNNSTVRNLMASMNRYTNNIRNNDGRITAVQNRAYNSTLDKAGNFLGMDNEGNSGYLAELKSKRQSEVENSNQANKQLTDLQTSGLPSDQISEKSAVLVKDIEESAKSVEALDKAIKRAELAVDKFKDLQDAGSEIKEVSPSRRTAFATYAAINSGRNMFSSGQDTLRQEQTDTRSLTAANGTYDSYAMRRTSETAGYQYGIKGSDMLAAENAYVQGAGYSSQGDVLKAGQRTGILANTTGATIADSTSLTGTYASTVNGANASDLTQFQRTFEGALNKSGMTKYGASQVKALDKLLGAVASQNGGSLTKTEANNLANLQGIAASSGNKALMGQQGADTLSNINSSITGGNSFVRQGLIMMNPSKYGNGIQGWTNQQYAQQEGLANKDVQQVVFGDKGPYKGLSAKERAALAGVNLGGTSAKTMEALQKAYDKNGGLTSKELQSAGLSSENSKLNTELGSNEGKNNKTDAVQQASETQLGQFVNTIKSNVGSTLANTLGLGLTTTALWGLTSALGGFTPIKIGRMIASTLTKAGTSTSEFATASTLSWSERAATNLKDSKLAATLNKTSAGQKVVGAVDGALTSPTVVNTSTKATSAIKNTGSYLSGATNEIEAQSLGFGGRVLSFANKAVPAATIAYEGASAITDKQNRGSHIGGTIGAGIGTGLGALTGNPLGMMVGATLGQVAGNLVGGLFDNKSTSKDDQATTNKKSEIEKQREKNIKAEKDLANKGIAGLNQKINNASGATNLSSNGKSPYDMAITAKSKAQKQAANPKVTISGKITHNGKVADTSQLQATTNEAINKLLTSPYSNESIRKS